eukprot:9282705-Pyramimonas_sp.AAC.1
MRIRQQTTHFPPETSAQHLSWLFAINRAMHCRREHVIKPALKILPKLASFIERDTCMWIDRHGFHLHMGE